MSTNAKVDFEIEVPGDLARLQGEARWRFGFPHACTADVPACGACSGTSRALRAMMRARRELACM